MPNPSVTRRRRTALVVTALTVSTAAAAGTWVAGGASAASRTIVVAPSGSDSAAGSATAPFRTIQKAVDTAGAGDTIIVRGGTYPVTKNIKILKDGTSGAPITLKAADGEKVVVDGDALPASHTAVGGSIARGDRGLVHMEADWWRITGLTLTRGPYGLYCDGCNHNVFDRLVTTDNYETGFQLQGASSDNLVLNLDSSLNHDPRKNGESADGIGIKSGSGSGNVVRGARLWNNVDDGIDLWDFASPVRIEGTVSYGNGVNRWGFPKFAGDGNGFKLGGGAPAPKVAHVVVNSVSFRNAAAGFTDNGNGGKLDLSRNTSWRNSKVGFGFGRSSSVLAGNLSVSDGSAVSKSSSTKSSGNSWDLGGSWTDARLRSTSTAAVTGSRSADGSIPTSGFLVPKDAAIGAGF